MQRRSRSSEFAGLLLAAATLFVPGLSMAAADKKPAAPVVITNHFFRTSDGARLHYLKARPSGIHKQAQVIVLVPGWSMPASLWRAQLRSLGRSHRVIAFDPRGQGQSEVPADGYHIDRRADDLHDLVSAHDKVVLVGWSLGALEVLQYLHRHGAGKLAGLVLVDSSVGEGQAGSPSRFQEELRRNRRVMLGEFIKAIFKTPRSEREIKSLVNGAMRMPLEASLSLFPSHVLREHWRETVHGYSGPLLYAVTPQFAEQARQLRSNRPGTRIEMFDKAGHALFVDEPERFNRLLGEFIDKSIVPGRTEE